MKKQYNRLAFKNTSINIMKLKMMLGKIRKRKWPTSSMTKKNSASSTMSLRQPLIAGMVDTTAD